MKNKFAFILLAFTIFTGSQSYSQSAKKYFKSGNTKYHNKDYNGAIADYTNAIEHKPDYFDAYFDRGLAKDNLKKYKEAIDDYTKAIEIKPKDFHAYFNRGTAKFDLFEYKEF